MTTPSRDTVHSRGPWTRRLDLVTGIVLRIVVAMFVLGLILRLLGAIFGFDLTD